MPFLCLCIVLLLFPQPEKLPSLPDEAHLSLGCPNCSEETWLSSPCRPHICMNEILHTNTGFCYPPALRSYARKKPTSSLLLGTWVQASAFFKGYVSSIEENSMQKIALLFCFACLSEVYVQIKCVRNMMALTLGHHQSLRHQSTLSTLPEAAKDTYSTASASIWLLNS